MARHVTLLCGPPCAGKSHRVLAHAQHDDLIVCFDHLARAAGSPHSHDHAPHHRAAAGFAYQRAIAQLAERADVRAWVIRCAPTPAEREQLADLVHADEVLVLIPPIQVALDRAARDGRARRTHGVIRGWYRNYRPRAGEQVIDNAPVVTSRAW